MEQSMQKTPLRVFTAMISLMMLGFAIAKGVSYYETMSAGAKAAENWGLGFSEEGKAPTANSTPEEMERFHAYYIGNQNKKTIYLTFDCGYENGYMESILNTLKECNVSATFFLVGNYLETEPELVKRMVNEGHMIGNHTYHHRDMSCMGKEEFAKELTDFETKLKEITGKESEKFYRPPQGKYSENSLKMADEMGYKTIFWSLAYVDWYDDNQPTKEQAFEKLLGRIHPGAVVLLHSTSKTNGEILGELIGKWREMGYSFGTLKEL
ncbi:MAG: polysaccharide deacetylase family protein [Lachnospiraceae bacterium]|nr:polysaccharide deacetylase family protein [Lachnospiraceae bacterium]